LNNRAVIFANGRLANVNRIHKLIRKDDFLIAVDGGSKHLRAINILPHLLIGDLDSISKKDLVIYKREGIKTLQFPRNKDKTDLELALDETKNQGFLEILIIGALGGRLDQTLGNIALLLQPKLENCQIHLDDGRDEVWLIKEKMRITGKVGDRISLLAINGPAEGIVAYGLKFPLKNETLYPYQTRGISNMMLSDSIHITLNKGSLLCIHTREVNVNELENK
jgi:thiamine pyrophosphokinase